MMALSTLVGLDAIPLLYAMSAGLDAEVADDVVGWLDGQTLVVTSVFFSMGHQSVFMGYPGQGRCNRSRQAHSHEKNIRLPSASVNSTSTCIRTNRTLIHLDGTFNQSGDTIQLAFGPPEILSKIGTRKPPSQWHPNQSCETLHRRLADLAGQRRAPALRTRQKWAPELTITATNTSVRPHIVSAEMRKTPLAILN